MSSKAFLSSVKETKNPMKRDQEPLTEDQTIQVTINGEKLLIYHQSGLDELIQKLDFNSNLVAVAVNEEFVPRGNRKTFLLKDGDRIEVLAPMAGG